MANLIKCPKCGEQIEITSVLRQEVEEKIRTETKELVRKEFEEKNSLEMADLKKTNEEAVQKAAESRERELKLREQNRKLEERDKELTLEVDKRVYEERKKAEEEAFKKADEEHRLKDMEKDKRLQDVLKTNEELQRKLQQGSQQTQGEIIELEIEDLLRKEFPNDFIKPVPKGVRGGDVIHEVKDRYGQTCGTILWESKNANWSDLWINKLKEDQRLVTADLAVLLSVNLPTNIKNFSSYGDRVWVTNRTCAISLAKALRINLYQVFATKLSAVGKNEKMETLYSYLIGTGFKQRVEAIVEGFVSLREELEKEKRYCATKWARQEKAIDKVLSQTGGMYGDLQVVIGPALPAIKSLEITSGEEEK